MKTIAVPVQHISLTAMEAAGWELDDAGLEERRMYGALAKYDLLGSLTQTQRRVLLCLSQGMRRREAARHLMVSLQAIHETVLRMRKRLIKKGTLANHFSAGRRQVYGI